MSLSKSNRRDFLRLAAGGAAAMGLGLGIRNRLNAAERGIFQSPPTLPGQQTAMGLTCEPLGKVRIGVIGLGMRGMDAVSRLLYVEGAEITAVCDVMPEKVTQAREIVTSRGKTPPAGYSDGPDHWMKLCERDDVDLVYSCTPWELHTPNAVYAMKQGKHAAVEVPAALA